ncbi:unnamed protein product [Kuraishia capsulata CBS 1993]|uniref:ATP-dependent RNA helicase DBP10 n=1 Tax=Kuraishia capsulata CBS 1993 TaxID=1382522 RepID=W6MG08_9ASCO|nr:uncharacterized protein KUCA_T00000587001 [Kuraishia capsulata CBS 1993]CDK24621.1 unnamed protein product [Kuraishia capsulata CBS 1993]
MSSSEDEEAYDIASNIALNASDSDSDNSSSDEESGQEVQDEIISSDEEEEVTKPKAKKQKKTNKLPSIADFPSLSADNEPGPAGDLEDYFKSADTKKAKAGSFASFGMSKFVLNNISKKGYRQPTPIQRKTIPLILDSRDVVGMARTGSGKTAAFILPIVEKLKTHVAKIGVRAVILSPSRELAAQTHKQFKEFSRGSDLRSLLLVGGDSLEDQFGSMMSNPDVIIATPGRFLHLKVEMNLDLSTVEYIVYDEADRLFEMGFAEQLNELLASLPPKRQSLLFSATLPASLVDFAKAGLSNPVLVRLDSEAKISDQLEMAFISTKRNEREANLLFILQEVIKLPFATVEELKKLEGANNEIDSDDEDNAPEGEDGKKRKRKFKKRERLPKANELPSPYSTIVFVPTRHHVEYVTLLLKELGYATSYIYGSLDQYARKRQMLNFRLGLSHVLVVTDVAARGIDIPVLANVVNYSLPASSKIFIHRVGRTARAGNKGWAYSIVGDSEIPYLLDLEMFLGKKVYLTSIHTKKIEIAHQKHEEANDGSVFEEPKVSYINRLVLGGAPRNELESYSDIFEGIIKSNYELKTLRDVSVKGEKLYFRTRSAASAESMRRAKELIQYGWDEQHLLFGKNQELAKDEFLAKLQNRNNKETVFEFSKKDDSMMDLMSKMRRQIAPIKRRAQERKELLERERMAGLSHTLEDEVLKGDDEEVGYTVAEDVLKEAFQDADDLAPSKKSGKRKSYRDEQFFLPHYAPSSAIQDKQLQLDTTSFVHDANRATFELDNDDKIQVHKQTQVMQWDRKKGNYVNSQSTDKKFIIGESGQRLPATYRSGKFDAWKSANNVKNLRAGLPETGGVRGPRNSEHKAPGGRFNHKQMKAPKLPDKARDDYFKQKKKVEKALDSGVRVKGYNRPGLQQEIKSSEQIRKQRESKDKRKQKTGRPQKKRH